MKTPLAALAAALILAAPFAASAQDVPSYAASSQSEDQQIRGRIASFDGDYNLQVTDDKGYVDNVQLHDGTIINPTGLTLAPGMVVSVLGYNAGQAFEANEIDTPYDFDAGVPYYAGHPWDYYGPTISLGFFFGGGGGNWWHRDDFGGGYHYNSGVRIYNDVHVRNDYRGGNVYRGENGGGRNFGGSQARGGYYSPRNAGVGQSHNDTRGGGATYGGNRGGANYGGGSRGANPGGGYHGGGGGGESHGGGGGGGSHGGGGGGGSHGGGGGGGHH